MFMYKASRKGMDNSKMLYLFFLFFIGVSSSLNSIHKCPNEQRDALLVFKQNISSINLSYIDFDIIEYCRTLHGSRYNPVKMNWKTSIDCCHWGGITCDNFTGDVIGLNLQCAMLHGVSELDILLASLPKLKAVDLSYNSLSVVTRNDVEYVNLDLSELRLASCNLTVFPDFIRAMKNLQVLDLSANYISGHIPSWAGEIGGNNLTYLDLSYNIITGLSEFRSDSLQYLNLYSNLIQGPFPSWVCSRKHLKFLDISFNGISGILPQCLQNISSSLVYLNVKSNMIQGQFPMTICNMSSLLYLDMSKNSISGMVPQCLQDISSSLVILNIRSNMIQGQFPTTICNMSSLLYLDMSNNSITGMVPQCLQNISSSLVTLNIGSNMIQGEFPTTICNMRSLLYLDMSNNSFHGVIPQCFGNITSSLAMINLGKNRFHGTIPEVHGYCGLVDGLILKGNMLEGQVPRSLEYCQSLKILDLGNNKLNGAFPKWLGYLPKLQVLILESNKLHGVIETPAAKEFLFPSLCIFDVSSNGFVGRLPEKYFESFNAIKDVDEGPKTEFANISGLHPYSINVKMKGLQLSYPSSVYIQVTYIDLSSNRFDGEIPDVIGKVKSLMALNLSNNNLNGRIPYFLGNMLNMEVLDLSRNQLVGEIPQSLLNLTYLSSFNVSQNNLVGRIPSGNQFQTFVNDSFLGNPKLCGPPLDTQCEDLSSPQVEAEGGGGVYIESVMLGLGFGTLLGVMLGYCMLSTGRPKWFSAIANAGRYTRRKKRKPVHIRKRN